MSKLPYHCLALAAFAAMSFLLLAGGYAQSQDDATGKPPASALAQASEMAASPPKTEPMANGQLTLVERVANLRRSISDDEARLNELRQTQEVQKEEFEQVGDAFQELEQQLEELEAQQEKLDVEQQPEEVQKLAERIQEASEKTEQAKERFDLAIQSYQISEQRIATLEARLKQSRGSLEKLLDTATDAESEEAAEKSAAMPPEGQVAQEPAEKPSPPAAPGVAPIPGAGAASAETTTAATPSEPPSEKVQAAEESFAKAQKSVEKAEQEVADVESRLKLLDKNIELSRAARTTALANARNTEKTVKLLEEQLEQARAADAGEEKLSELRQQLADARRRWHSYQKAVQEEGTALNDLHAERAKLLTEQVAALQTAEAQQEEARKAELELAKATNPFSPENLKAWVIRHGPPVLVILAGIVVARLLVTFLARRIIHLIVGGSRRGSEEEREQRGETLVGVFRNTATFAIYAGAILMILDELAIPIATLMGGVAVIGLAVAFGAQNLIKDYFYGFMILLENQYRVNDVVRIAGIAGLVENITLRMTVLRDLEGIVHFVPHGEVKTVSNMTHGWSRAVFDIGIAYKEDADRVMEVLKELATELRQDPEFSSLIVDDPEMLGVDAFGDSAVVIKLLIKTRPLKQWSVKREMLRRVKRRFDELGIEIPFPHRTIYHHHETSDPNEFVPHGRSDGDPH